MMDSVHIVRHSLDHQPETLMGATLGGSLRFPEDLYIHCATLGGSLRFPEDITFIQGMISHDGFPSWILKPKPARWFPMAGVAFSS